jgi:hypothetical protein
MPNTEALDILSAFLTNARGGNCGTGSGGFKKGNTCASGTGGHSGGSAPELKLKRVDSDTLAKGHKVTITGGKFAGRTAVVEIPVDTMSWSKTKQALVVFDDTQSTQGGTKAFVDHRHLKTAGVADEKYLKGEEKRKASEKEMIARETQKEKAQEKAQLGQPKPLGKATKYTLAQLNDASERAGQSLFSGHQSGLVRDRASKVRYRALSELKATDAALDEYEYVFKPSTGKGLDVASYDWKSARASWADKDGLIYSQYGDTIHITDTKK